MNQTIQNESRRRFLKSTAGLTLALYLPLASGKNIDTTTTFEPNAFLRIAEDNSVTVIAKHLEMGQGTYTGLATLVAEELDAAWSQVRVEAAPANAKRYSNLNWGAQGTGGSSAINNSWEQMRQAGASARAMLVMAAAKRWNVATKDIHVVGGVLSHSASGKTANFGQLASAAAEQAVPEQVTLKKPKDFKLIGQQHLPRKDSKAKTNGSAIYTQDIHLPNMLTAVVAHPPRFGGKVKSFNASKSLEIKGVVEVVQIPSGVAVLATGTWAAKKGRDALHIEWDETTAFKQSSDDLIDQYKTLAKSPGTIARQEGNADKALTNASQTLEAEYDFPYLAHAAMEPMNCVIKLSKDRCETWYGAQLQTADQAVLAKIFALQPEQVHINTLYAGGSFGRRASKNHDYIIEAAHIVKASDTHAPVKLVWMREDDTQAGNYRPMFHHRLKAGLDNKGNLVSWQHRLVGQSIMANSPFEGSIKNGIDPTSVEGAMNLPYAIANIQVDLHSPNIAVPIQWWRVVGSSHTAFSTECFIDELAQAANKDPVTWRLSLLKNHPRHAGVLKLAAEKSNWTTPLPKSDKGQKRGRGVAVHEAFGSYVAQVAEVTVQSDGSYHVDRVICAVDCGVAVNPDVIRAQVEGSVGFALSAAMNEAITFTDGKVDQSNFHNYLPLRMPDMPSVEVHIVASTIKPTGIGEPPVAPLAPAVVNAIAAATGKRIRRLPIGSQVSS